jgi:hypothetical protein
LPAPQRNTVAALDADENSNNEVFSASPHHRGFSFPAGTVSRRHATGFRKHRGGELKNRRMTLMAASSTPARPSKQSGGTANPWPKW